MISIDLDRYKRISLGLTCDLRLVLVRWSYRSFKDDKLCPLTFSLAVNRSILINLVSKNIHLFIHFTKDFYQQSFQCCEGHN